MHEIAFMQPHQLTDAGHQIGNFPAEAALDLLRSLGRQRGQLEQHAGDTGVDIGLQQCQRRDHAAREGHGVLPGLYGLALVRRTHELHSGQQARAVGGIQPLRELLVTVADSAYRYHCLILLFQRRLPALIPEKIPLPARSDPHA